MPTIRLNTDCICLGHQASNVWSLQENSQSEPAYYCSHIIKWHRDRPTLINKWFTLRSRELFFWWDQSRKSRAGEIGPSCSLGQPILTEDSLHLAARDPAVYSIMNTINSLWKLNVHCPFMGLNSKHFSGCCFYGGEINVTSQGKYQWLCIKASYRYFFFSTKIRWMFLVLGPRKGCLVLLGQTLAET